MMERVNKYMYPELWFAALFVSFPPRGNKSYTWEEMGNYYHNLVLNALENRDNEFIDSIAHTISGGSLETIIENTYNFVKNNIRYYGSWEGSYGWIPRGSKEVLEKGYGDCKEMANLLAVLLQKKGVPASLTLLRRNRKYHFKMIKKYPTLDLSDHAITCAELRDGRRLYLDPTSKNASAVTSYFEYLNQHVLVTKEKGSYLDTVKPGPEYENKIITNSIIKQENSIDKNWLIEGDIVLYGEVANDLYMNLKEPQKDSKAEVTRDFMQDRLKFRPLKVELILVGNTEISMHYTAKFRDNVLTSPTNGLILSTPSLYTPHASFSDLSVEGNRYIAYCRQVDTWKIPTGYSKFNLSNLSSSYGKGSWTHSGNAVTREYACDTHFVTVTERKKLETFFKERRTFSHGIVWSGK